MLTALCRGATFGMTDDSSIITNGVLILRGSFQQKEIFNASGNVTGKGPGGSPSAQQDHFQLSNCSPWLALYFGMYAYAIVPVVGTLWYVMTRMLFYSKNVS